MEARHIGKKCDFGIKDGRVPLKRTHNAIGSRCVGRTTCGGDKRIAAPEYAGGLEMTEISRIVVAVAEREQRVDAAIADTNGGADGVGAGVTYTIAAAPEDNEKRHDEQPGHAEDRGRAPERLP